MASSNGHRRQFVPEALSVAQTGHTVNGNLGERTTKWWPFVYDDATVAVFGLPVDTGPITQEAITLLQGLAEVIVYQHFLLDKIQSAERVRAEFLKTTLTAGSIDADDVHRQADILQLNLRQPQAVILIHIGGLEDEVAQSHTELSSEEQLLQLDVVTESIANSIRDSFRLRHDNLVAYIGNDQFVLLKSINGDHLTTLNTIRYLTEQGDLIQQLLQKLQPNRSITVGVGQYYPDLGGLRKSYQDAKLALEVGTKVWTAGRVYHIKRVGMFITLANTSARSQS